METSQNTLNRGQRVNVETMVRETKTQLSDEEEISLSPGGREPG